MNTARNMHNDGLEEFSNNINQSNSWFIKVPYNSASHGWGAYGDDFIYITDKISGEVFVIGNSQLSNFNDVKDEFEWYDVFCYSETRTWTSYKSYVPVDWWVILQTNSKIDNILETVD